MRYEYKTVKVALPHCPKCKERLIGNGSAMTPYSCKCGIWEYNFEEEEYRILPHKSNQK